MCVHIHMATSTARTWACPNHIHIPSTPFLHLKRPSLVNAVWAAIKHLCSERFMTCLMFTLRLILLALPMVSSSIWQQNTIGFRDILCCRACSKMVSICSWNPCSLPYRGKTHGRLSLKRSRAISEYVCRKRTPLAET